MSNSSQRLNVNNEIVPEVPLGPHDSENGYYASNMVTADWMRANHQTNPAHFGKAKLTSPSSLEGRYTTKENGEPIDSEQISQRTIYKEPTRSFIQI